MIRYRARSPALMLAASLHIPIALFLPDVSERHNDAYRGEKIRAPGDRAQLT